jgi:SpoIID/LytB domain protein
MRALSPRAWVVWATAWVLSLTLIGCGGSREPVMEPGPGMGEAGVPRLRVGILVHVNEVQVGSTVPFALRDDDGVMLLGGRNEIFNIFRQGNRVVVHTAAGELIDSANGVLRLEPREPGGEVIIGGARYPQELEVVSSPQGGLNVVNVVDLETYLRGVVPMEIGHQDGGYLEAAKSLAVAARTYVAAHMGQYPEEGFDLHSGVTDQVYGSVDRRHPNADRAVGETRGLILLYEGRPIRANYASTCGGRTAGVEESFNSDPIPYLRSHPDKFKSRVACRNSKYYRWSVSWTGTELFRVLERTVPRELGRPWRGRVVREVRVIEKGKSGRVVKLRVKTDRETYELEKGMIRWVMESTEGRSLRSTAFELEVRGGEDGVRLLTATGRGWGHGVGLCQWGTMQLSRDGVDFRRILEHYYPDTRITYWYGESTARNARPGSRRGNHG